MSILRSLAIVLVLACRVGFAAAPGAELIEVDKIWDQSPHSAFTDLIHWNGQFICAFREGRGHVSSDGRIRVLTSTDGDKWRSSSLVALDGYDLRDAGLSAAPDGRLMLIGGAAPRRRDNEIAPTGTFVSFSEDAVTWTEPTIVVEPGRWLWRVTWHDRTAYGISYAAGTPDRATALLVSDDGLHFQAAVPKLLGDAGTRQPVLPGAGSPTEAVLRFDDGGTLYCLQRRDGKPPENTALLGISRPPYTKWQWHDLGIYFGGPNLIKIPSGQWIAAGRILRDAGPKTELAWLDIEAKALQPILQLPSGGDTSYPGLVWHADMLWVSYYSSHEGKASIYLAKVQID